MWRGAAEGRARAHPGSKVSRVTHWCWLPPGAAGTMIRAGWPWSGTARALAVDVQGRQESADRPWLARRAARPGAPRRWSDSTNTSGGSPSWPTSAARSHCTAPAPPLVLRRPAPSMAAMGSEALCSGRRERSAPAAEADRSPVRPVDDEPPGVLVRVGRGDPGVRGRLVDLEPVGSAAGIGPAVRLEQAVRCRGLAQVSSHRGQEQQQRAAAEATGAPRRETVARRGAG